MPKRAILVTLLGDRMRTKRSSIGNAKTQAQSGNGGEKQGLHRTSPELMVGRDVRL
jgi:hypothetical protein